MRRLLGFVILVPLCCRAASAGEIGFVEHFALAQDRATALTELIPGTEEYYYYHCLYYLQTEQFDKVQPTLVPWVQRFGETARVREIRTRHALLTYDRDPRATLAYLIERLNVNHSHQQLRVDAEPNLPTSLDQQIISRAQFIARAESANRDHLNDYEDSALDWLTNSPLNPNQRRNLLSRLTRPDYANLVKLIADDLNYTNSGGFGSHAIHGQLLLVQLEELLKLKPELLNQQNFVQTYLAKLQPGADEDWRHDTQLLQGYLDRLWTFAQRLAPVHNSLRAHVLYQRLLLDRQRGVYDKQRFLTYLQLPRAVPYAAKAFLESEAVRRFACDLNADYGGVTLLPPVGSDEPLVRSYLAHFLLDAANTREFEPYINDVYLRHLLAEVKIVNGLGNDDQWAALLPPAQFKQLKERVDIDFAFENKLDFTAGEPVTLDLYVKNVPTLIVKVFEINTKSYYQTQLREVDTDINLDGLVANDEQTHDYTDPPLRRVARRFSFPQLTKPGVYVIDFIGSGQSSRALIRKGRLSHVVRTGAAGQVFTIFDQQRQRVTNASIWLAGHEYAANADGTITVPFSNDPGIKPIVISQGELSCLDRFQHQAENYSLVAGLYVDRESLLARKKAQLLVRPSLLLNGTPASVKVLEEVKLLITSTDLDGIATAQEVPKFPLYEDRETVHEFQVPPRTATITFTLSAKVPRLTAGNEKVDLATSESFTLNEIDKTDKIEDLHLLRVADGYILELLGKTGEPKASRPVRLAIKHRDFRQTVYVTLKTDDRGRVQLGPLSDIAQLTANGPEGTSHDFVLRQDQHSYGQVLHGGTSEALSVPLLSRRRAATARAAGKPTRDEVSLLELRGETFVADRFDALAVRDGLLTISKLPPGDYDLYLKSAATRLRVRITAGDSLDQYLVGKLRVLETKRLAPVQVAAIDVDERQVTVRLANASKFARVHVFATRFLPEYAPFDYLSRVRAAEPDAFLPGRAETAYLTGRNIGDEYRYIIDRKYAPRYPGNSLQRPSLLLNPWAVRSTETGQVDARAGNEFVPGAPPSRSEVVSQDAAAEPRLAPSGNFANLDFLADSSAVLVNLAPDDQGVIAFDRAALGPHQQIHVVAVDPLHTTYRSVTLPEQSSSFVDLRLLKNLDPQGHFTLQKEQSVLAQGQPFELADITTSKFEIYDSLARVYALYATINPDPKLAEFAFVTRWPELSDDEKRSFYSRYASHELSFLLANKDPEFYRQVIVPYLANKKDKTFVDRWLLEADLRDQLQPWNHAQLNIVERILLGQRIETQRAATARHVDDLFRLLPPNIERTIQLFDTSVKGLALSTDDKLGLEAAARRFTPEGRYDAAEGALGALADQPAGQSRGEAAGAVGGVAANALRSFGAGKPSARPSNASERLAQADKDGAELMFRGRRKEVDRQVDQLEKAQAESEEAQAFFALGAVEQRKSLRALYRKLNPTMEWAENNYHHLTIDQQNADLVSVSAFWNDYAQRDPSQPFQSRHVAEASRNFTEMMLALAVLDLPFESPEHETRFDGPKMTFTPAGPVIAFHEQIKPAAPWSGPSQIMVSQNYFKQNDRYTEEAGERIDKYVTDEFVIHNVYTCQVVVTNTTSARQKLNVLLQVPRGALPVLNGQATRTVYVSLEPYHTQTLEYSFYFPAPGDFPHFPAHVARNEQLVANANPFTFHVVERPTRVDTQSWEYVSQYGSPQDVVAFLNRNNVQGLNLDLIAWRMRDAEFFAQVTALLTARHAYNHTLWGYALLHNVVPECREFLQHADAIVNECGGRLLSPLLTVNPVVRHSYEHLEYMPLVNARAHQLGPARQIVNDRFHSQYQRFLNELAHTRAPDDVDLMDVTYYLLLQDRVDEALQVFNRISASRLETRLQYEYLAAYMKLFTYDFAEARATAEKYREYPVDRWRNAFAALAAQLDEAEGHEVTTVDAEDQGQQQTQLAATAPSFDFQVEGQQITLNYQNLDRVRVNYYLVDVELMFSRNPFVQQFQGQFSSIRPNFTEDVALESAPTGGTRAIALPPALNNKNILVEIVGGGVTKNQPYYSHSMAIQVIDTYGQVRITEASTGKPIAAAYVKVYARTDDGRVKFYKDGYTDIRGRFDYASLSTNDLDQASRFAILVVSEQHGAAVREATPPQQ